MREKVGSGRHRRHRRGTCWMEEDVAGEQVGPFVESKQDGLHAKGGAG